MTTVSPVSNMPGEKFNAPLIIVLAQYPTAARLMPPSRVLNDGATFARPFWQLVGARHQMAAAPSQKEKPANLLTAFITQNIRNGDYRLETVTILADFVRAKKIKVVGAQYDLATSERSLSSDLTYC